MSADRMHKVNEAVRLHVAESIQRDIELPLGSFVTITHVQTTRDLQHADVYVLIIPDGKRASILKMLTKNIRNIQKRLGRELQMKFTPKIRFRLDEGEIKAQAVYSALDTDPDLPPQA